MKSRIMFKLILIIIFCLSLNTLISIDPNYTRPSQKRIESTANYRTTYFPFNRISTITEYGYSPLAPCMIESITSTTWSTNTSETITESYLNSSVHTIGGLTTTEYNEYRMPDESLYAYYKFVENQNNDLVEIEITHPNLEDSFHVYYHYYATGKPDSIYYRNSATATYYYKMQYDEQDRLCSSIQYILDYNEWYPFRRYSQNYGQNPFRYSAPLDFNNFRFYSLVLGGFEDSSPIIDKYYAPETITFESWDSEWNEWYPINSTYYGVEIEGNTVAVVNGNANNYVGNFYFDENGTYTGKFVYYTYSSDVFFSVNWSNPVASVDPAAITPAAISISAYPNPFKTNLNIKFNSKAITPADISIYNIKGQLIRSWKMVKSNELTWDGKDNAHQPVSGGVYLIKARQGSITANSKIIKL